MGASNSNRSVAQQEEEKTIAKDELSIPKAPVDKQSGKIEAVSVQKKRRWRSHKGSSKKESKKARRTRRAEEGISTGPRFVVPPELARLRRSWLYKDLPPSVCREKLDRSIKEQIITEGEEDEDLVETPYVAAAYITRYGTAGTYLRTYRILNLLPY